MIELSKVKKWTSAKEGWASDPVILTQIQRNDRVAMYSRAHENCAVRGYEVFLIKVIKAGTPGPGGGVEKEDREVYPRASSFGFTAWCIANLDRANYKFEELTKAGITADAIKEEGEESGETVIEDEGITWPVGKKFSCTELSELYKVSYTDVYIAIKKAVKDNIIRPAGDEEREEGKKGKKRSLFELVDETQTTQPPATE
jgi:hypothetical protein